MAMQESDLSVGGHYRDGNGVEVQVSRVLPATVYYAGSVEGYCRKATFLRDFTKVDVYAEAADLYGEDDNSPSELDIDPTTHPSYANLNVEGTVTGRITSQTPHFEEVEKGSAVPSMIVNADYSTLEQRVLANQLAQMGDAVLTMPNRVGKATTLQLAAKLAQGEAIDTAWGAEPDFKRFWHNGMLCVVLRTRASHLCGYVRVPQGKLLRKIKKREDLLRWRKPIPPMRRLRKRAYDLPELSGLECHGGLTWCGVFPPVKGVPLKMQGHYWIGFDCAHFGDFVPETFRLLQKDSLGGTYRTFDYVEEQVRGLADQLKDVLAKG